MLEITHMALTTPSLFHFGRRGIGLNETEVTMSADTLFSAFCYAYSLLNGASGLESLLARFPTAEQTSTPPFRLTSLMPRVGTLDLLPMPQLHANLPTNKHILEARKQFKDIKWVSEAIFQPLVQGHSLGDSLEFVDKDQKPYTLQNGAVWVTQEQLAQLGGEKRLLWHIQTRPRVTVDRVTSKAAAYSSGSIRFAADVTLYCLIRWDDADQELRKNVESAFRALGDEGIGGERSYGHGHFVPTPTPYYGNLGAPQGDYFTTLSPYLPQKSEQEVFQGAVRYEISLRRGWISATGYSNLRRPTVRMVETGAVLATPAGAEPIGCLADATPEMIRSEITIYRYGLAWPVIVTKSAAEGEER